MQNPTPDLREPRDWLKWVALGFALIGTAHAEWHLAVQVGFHPVIAACVPGALDVWIVRAMRQHRDVFAGVLAMILVNTASHLVSANLITVSVPLVVAVSAIAPLVLWRLHTITGKGVEVDAPAAPVNTAPSAPVSAPVAPAVQVNTPAPAPLPAPRPKLHVICGEGQPFTLDAPEPRRLSTEEAAAALLQCFKDGVSVREAARVSTRSPAYVSKVFTELRANAEASTPSKALVLVNAGGAA